MVKWIWAQEMRMPTEWGISILQFMSVLTWIFSRICLKLWVCLYNQLRHIFHSLVSLIFYLNRLQRSSPKEHNPCQILQALSTLASIQGPKMPVPGPWWVLPASRPRSSVFSSTSLLVDWGGEDQRWVGLVESLEAKTMQSYEKQLKINQKENASDHIFSIYIYIFIYGFCFVFSLWFLWVMNMIGRW